MTDRKHTVNCEISVKPLTVRDLQSSRWCSTSPLHLAAS